MNVVQLLFALQPGLRVAKSGRFPFLCFLLSPGDGPARFIAGADNGMTAQ